MMNRYISCVAEFECQNGDIFVDYFDVEYGGNICQQIKLMIFKSGEIYKRFLFIERFGLNEGGYGSG